MGDHFMLLADHLLTESTLEAALRSKDGLPQGAPLESESSMTDPLSHTMDVNMGSSPKKMVECRICHDEDEDSNMEIPCSCCGSLKYAHRRCIQMWCNEKGDTVCEICHQQFKPGYTAPPPLFHYGGIPMNFRGNWEISRRELHNPGFIALVSTNQNFLDEDFDEYPVPSPRSLICCRVVAIIFMTLLVLRHTLPIIIYGGGEYSFTLFTLLVLRTVGILLPMYVMVKAFTAFQRRRLHQDSRNFSGSTSDEENEPPRQQLHFIRIQ